MDVRHCQSYRRSHLRRLHDQSPIATADLWRFFRHNDHVSRSQRRAHRIATPPTSAVVFRGEHRPVGANHEGGFFVRKLCYPTGLAEIPFGAMARPVTDGCRVEDLAVNHHIAGFLRNEKYVAIADLHICSRVLPVLHIRRDMHYHPPDWSARLQLSECCFCLPDCCQLRVLLVSIRVRQRFERYLLRFDSLHKFHVGFQLQLAHFSPHQHCPIRIGFRTKSSASCQYGTQSFSRCNAVCTAMQDFSANRHGCSDVGPARQLSNRQNVSVAQGHISLRIAGHYCCQIYLQPVTWPLLRTVHFETRQVGAFCIRTPFQSTSYAHQIFDAHVCGEWIAPRLGHFSLDENRWRINAARIAVHQQAVSRLHHHVVHGISRESFLEIDAQNFHRAVGLRSEELRGVQRSVLRDPACQIDRVPQVRLPRSAVLPGFPNFATNPDFRCRLKIVAAKDANGIKRLQLWSGGRVRQRRG